MLSRGVPLRSPLDFVSPVTRDPRSLSTLGKNKF